MKTLIWMAALMVPASAFAQAPQAPVDPAPGDARVNQVIVYGADPCPQSSAEEIVVCVRSQEQPYRLPKAMRGDPQKPSNQAWGERARSIEYVGRTGMQSCTPVGSGGASGCFNQIVRQARAERAAGGNWSALVSAERAKRLGTIDADSDAIEADVKADEAAAAAANASPPVAPPPPDAGPAQ